jgi:hypothetical protein
MNIPYVTSLAAIATTTAAGLSMISSVKTVSRINSLVSFCKYLGLSNECPKEISESAFTQCFDKAVGECLMKYGNKRYSEFLFDKNIALATSVGTGIIASLSFAYLAYRGYKYTISHLNDLKRFKDFVVANKLKSIKFLSLACFGYSIINANTFYANSVGTVVLASLGIAYLGNRVYKYCLDHCRGFIYPLKSKTS